MKDVINYLSSKKEWTRIKESFDILKYLLETDKSDRYGPVENIKITKVGDVPSNVEQLKKAIKYMTRMILTPFKMALEGVITLNEDTII